MDRARNHRRLMPIAALTAVAAGAFFGAAPAEAQDGSRYRVLVPALAPMAGADDDFGKDVADEVRDALDDFTTHASVESKVLKDALKKFDLDEEEISDCIKARQLAVQIQAELVMCGEYQENGETRQVSSKFVAPTTGEEFVVEPFSASRPEDAAAQITTAFQTYLEQLRLAVFCNDELSRQAWEAAIERCGKVVEMNPRSATNQYNLAMAYMNAEQNEQALATFEQVVAINPVHQDAMLAAGVVAAKIGQTEKSQQYLKQYLELNPGNLQVRMKIAGDVAQAGDPRGALAIVEAGINPDSVDAQTVMYAGHFALAAARDAMENPPAGGEPADATVMLEKALQYYTQAFDLQGSEADPTMLANIMLVYRLLERPQEAVAFGERAVQAKPDDATLWSAHADALAAADRTEEAVQALARAQQIDPQLAVNARLGYWQLDQGNLSAAQASFRKAIANGDVETGDEIARRIFAAGYNTHQQNGRYDTAISYYEVAREFATESSTNGMVNFFQGYALFQKAVEVQEPATPASARASLPIFREAQRWLEQAGAYTEQAQQRRQMLDHIGQYIDRQNAIIAQG